MMLIVFYLIFDTFTYRASMVTLSTNTQYHHAWSETMSYELILSEVRARVGVITMNRPDKLNAMNPQMNHEIISQIVEWSEDDSVGAIVWTGAGRGFCAGADIGRFEARRDGQAADNAQPLVEDSWHEVIRNAKPVIAAINGVAIGEGLTRTLPCDVRIASESARLSFRFVRVGLTPEFASTHYAPHLIGLGRTLEYMLRGNLIPSDEALRVGLVNYVYPDDEMLDKAVELATEIADNPVWQLSQVKRLVHQNYIEHDVETVLSDEGPTFQTAMKSDAHKEALTAFREKRQPRFN
ncbi:MAG: enoyl-CoA hydratase [Dehalococcoidia bacterium]|nr:enoyl-CoA hydratase [Dehalococcoidia bacterium]